MTHSGQGDERHPDARPAREGVVLPADGSGPWVPGEPADRTAPAGGQPWGEPWGTQQPVTDPSAQGPYASPELSQPYAQHPGYGPPDADPYGSPGVGVPTAASGPLPDEVAPAAPPYDSSHGHAPHQQFPGAADATAYLPPVPPGSAGGMDATQVIPPVSVSSDGPGVPGAADATAYLPPVPPGPAGGMDATQVIPPVSVSSDGPGVPGAADATAYLPPVTPGALPPERPAPPSHQRSTGSYGQQPVPDAPTSAPYGIRPGAPGDRPPPAEFDNLFRTGAAPDPTPPTDGFAAASHPQPPAPPRSRRRQDGSGPRRRSSVPMVGVAVVVGCAVLGLGVSAVVFGGDDEQPADSVPGNNVAAAPSTPSAANSPKAAAADPVEQQARALDRLLDDSNDSRAVVIQSVANIKECKDLDQASRDLRGAADQRRGLVERLEKLEIDRLPEHGELAESLTDAWKASAAADDHYAVWAKQVKSKKWCRDGRARTSKRASQGNRASGEATSAKREAAGLWNPIAARYDLTERRSDQL
ncbi:hypothetical protein [Streptomyces sp. NBC_00690]|uniref:hypothetical protein n=1 Tax=Streptomyces sp. NBC_00690 TaxID=2975808 RepID=UPI002E27AA9B|nr:hypothetical protein [Streptomyces sp. NBC_00690]